MKYKYEYFINRELSWLEFNDRVLNEAVYEENPLLEKCKYLSITSSNLDEFFMTRIGALKAQIDSNFTGKDISGMTPKQQMEKTEERIEKLIKKQYTIYNNEIIPDTILYILPYTSDCLDFESFFFESHKISANSDIHRHWLLYNFR